MIRSKIWTPDGPICMDTISFLNGILTLLKVYKAVMTVDINNRTGYEVAVKYLKIKENPDRMDELRADFEYETNLMKTLNHPNVVKLLGLASNLLGTDFE